MVKRELHVANEKNPRHTTFHFLWVSSKILVFADSCGTATTTGVEVIPQGPLEGDHMANASCGESLVL